MPNVRRKECKRIVVAGLAFGCLYVAPGQAQSTQDTPAQAGQRQTRADAAPNINPMSRISNRVQSRIQSRIDSRIAHKYDTKINTTSPSTGGVGQGPGTGSQQ